MAAHRGLDPGLGQAGLQHRGMGFRRVIVGHLHRSGTSRRGRADPTGGSSPRRDLPVATPSRVQGSAASDGQAVPRAGVERRRARRPHRTGANWAKAALYPSTSDFTSSAAPGTSCAMTTGSDRPTHPRTWSRAGAGRPASRKRPLHRCHDMRLAVDKRAIDIEDHEAQFAHSTSSNGSVGTSAACHSKAAQVLAMCSGNGAVRCSRAPVIGWVSVSDLA
jgi:hypothetical protein